VGKLLLVIVVLGVAIYLLVRLIELQASRRRKRGGGGGALGKLRPAPPKPSGPIGPDDDPEFLRDLNRRKRHKDDER
jgi:hypothetical protein